jgi:hypothetical protein
MIALRTLTMRRLRMFALATVAAATLGLAAGPAAAQPIDPDRGPGPGYKYCVLVWHTYHGYLDRQEWAAIDNDVRGTAQWSAAAVATVAEWHRSGCQAAYRGIDGFI